jgi:hypothetical protein
MPDADAISAAESRVAEGDHLPVTVTAPATDGSRGALLAVSLALFCIQVDFFALNLAPPDMARAFHGARVTFSGPSALTCCRWGRRSSWRTGSETSSGAVARCWSASACSGSRRLDVRSRQASAYWWRCVCCKAPGPPSSSRWVSPRSAMSTPTHPADRRLASRSGDPEHRYGTWPVRGRGSRQRTGLAVDLLGASSAVRACLARGIRQRRGLACAFRWSTWRCFATFPTRCAVHGRDLQHRLRGDDLRRDAVPAARSWPESTDRRRRSSRRRCSSLSQGPWGRDWASTFERRTSCGPSARARPRGVLLTGLVTAGGIGVAAAASAIAVLESSGASTHNAIDGTLRVIAIAVLVAAITVMVVRTHLVRPGPNGAVVDEGGLRAAVTLTAPAPGRKLPVQPPARPRSRVDSR